MIFKSISIIEGMFYRKIDFSDCVNIVYSEKNSTGKTTLLRLLLYSMGFSIPNTQKLDFKKCRVEAIVETKNETLNIKRQNDYLEVYNYDKKNYYVLPNELDAFHGRVFGTNNKDILNNILGAFYIDQEKGWTLLNRGTVIGKLKFNIEELIRGVSGKNCDNFLLKLNSIETELKKYKQMFNIAEYRKEINELSDNIAYENYDEELEKEIANLFLEISSYEKELKRVNKVIEENKLFKNYIEKMNIMVRTKDGEEIPVIEENIVGFNNNTEYLLSKRKLIVSTLSSLKNRIEERERILNKDIALFETESLIETFDKKILNIKINESAVSNVIKNLEKEKRKLKKIITNQTKGNNKVITDLYNIILKYAKELNVEKYMDTKKDYIFTNDLKSLSGAVLHKIVFVFKLSYITILQNKLDILLPIILDSPSGREVKRYNVDNMIRILNRDFKNNQIIIASIFDYVFDKKNIITIKDKLIDESISNM